MSSLTDLLEGLERYVVVYQRAIPPIGIIAPAHDDIVGQLFTGTTSQPGEINLSSLLNTTGLESQLNPSVDKRRHRLHRRHPLRHRLQRSAVDLRAGHSAIPRHRARHQRHVGCDILPRTDERLRRP
ncbi:MAG: hypothetical protein ABIP94_02645 [Planctomycetota bacterium]